MKKVFIIIPSLDPDEKVFLPFIDKLAKKFSNIIIVDDGSKNELKSVFNKVENKCVILRHYKNMGKGRALKTAINYILNNYKQVDTIVTADSDGQHAIDDIVACAKTSIENPDAYILGCRNIKGKNVPFKSKYGNLITRGVMRLFVGINISDTQTGLRAMSSKVAAKFLTTIGERFEYETNTLIECKMKSIPIVEVPIETIYINDNSGSHFNPFKDSISIYKLFFKYILSAASSFILDVILFTIFYKLLDNSNSAFIATVMARIISSLYNFFVNSKLVFKNMSRSSFIKYVLLVIIQMFVSACSVNYFGRLLPINILVIKIAVDTIIFVVNFIVQREFVFKDRKKN